MNLQDALSSGIQALGLDLPADTPERLDAFARLLIKWNKVYNLTAIRDEGQVLTHHLLDSLSALPALAGIEGADLDGAVIGPEAFVLRYPGRRPDRPWALLPAVPDFHHVALAGIAQEGHLGPVVRAPLAHGQVQLQAHLLGKAELSVLGFGHEAGGLSAAQHRDGSGENQFLSRHRRSPLRARCRMTLQLPAVISRAWQISAVSSSRNSRIMKTRAVLAGR